MAQLMVLLFCRIKSL